MTPALDFWMGLTYERVVLTLVLLGVAADLIVDWRSAQPFKRANLKAQLIDEGITLAERHGGPPDVKLRNAVDWVMQRASDHKLKLTRNEAAKLVEIRLPRKVKT